MKLNRWLALMRSAESADRAEAADALPEADISSEIVDLMLAALQDEDPLVRTCAADTIGEITDDRVRARILERLREEEDDLVRAHLLSSLGAMEHPEDLALIANEMSSSANWIVRLHAAYGLLVSSLGQSMNAIVASCNASDWKEQTKAFSVMAVAADNLRDVLTDIDRTARDHHDAAERGDISGVARSKIEHILKN